MQHMITNENGTWDAATMSGPALRMQRGPRLCGYCGDAEREDEPMDTAVIDWRAVLICGACVESHDWRHYSFDPLTNTYTHINGSYTRR